MKKQYCYSWDSERYYGEFDTKKEAIDEARRDRPEEEFVYIGTCSPVLLKWRGGEEEIINSIIDNLDDDFDDGGDYIDITREDELILAKMIDNAVEAWIEKRGIKSSGYIVLDGHRIDLV